MQKEFDAELNSQPVKIKYNYPSIYPVFVQIGEVEFFLEEFVDKDQQKVLELINNNKGD